MESSKRIHLIEECNSNLKEWSQTAKDAWGSPVGVYQKSGTTPTSTCTTSTSELSFIESDEDYAEYYQGRINESQSKQLYPLMEDLSDWINKTLDINYIQGNSLLDFLDNGVLLCQLAKIIQKKAETATSVTSSSLCLPIPTISAKCFKTAARRSFFSRDNTEKFIQFCKKLGVHENLLFESDDLVLQNKPRNVILCLMEVSRLAVKYGIEPPGLIKFEHEIAEQEELEIDDEKKLETSEPDCHYSQNLIPSWQSQNVAKPFENRGKSYGGLTSTSSERNLKSNGRGNLRRSISEGTRMNGIKKNNIFTNTNLNSGKGREKKLNNSEHKMMDVITQDTKDDCIQYGLNTQCVDDLDKKVQQATNFVQKHCRCANGKCEKLKIKKIGEGKYTIGGRNVFIRLLKGRHMMVRVGGGWDTLENFLARHDPCQSVGKSIIRSKSPSPPKNNVRRHSNSLQYRSSPVESLVSRQNDTSKS